LSDGGGGAGNRPATGDASFGVDSSTTADAAAALSFEAWTDLGCDCSTDNPCPMLCDGVTIEHMLGATWTGAPCEMLPETISADEPCPEQVSSSCGMVLVNRLFSYPLMGPPGNRLRWWYDPVTLGRVGWSAILYGVRVCGGIAPDGDTCPQGYGDACETDPSTSTCPCLAR
jgi:hypothetical protein